MATYYLEMTDVKKIIIVQEAKESFASPDNLFYGKLHIVMVFYL